MAKIKSRFAPVAAPLLALLLGSCSLVPVTVGPTDLYRYTPGYAALFAGNGQLILIGSAFSDAAATQAFAETAATNVAQGSMAGRPFTLTANLGDQPQAKNRVVVVIGGGNELTLCATPPASGGTVKAGEPFRVAVASCNGEDRLASTTGRLDRPVTGPDDPNIAYLFQQIGAELFPIRNPDYEPDHNDWSNN